MPREWVSVSIALAEAGHIIELVGSEFQNESSPAEGSAGRRSLAGHRHIPLAALTKNLHRCPV